ncbi:MAG: hypothetical protein ABSG86_25650 [Thermoguttaceae bacterium]
MISSGSALRLLVLKIRDEGPFVPVEDQIDDANQGDAQVFGGHRIDQRCFQRGLHGQGAWLVGGDGLQVGPDEIDDPFPHRLLVSHGRERHPLLVDQLGPGLQ